MITKFWPRVQQQHITICIALYIRLRLIIQTMQKRINIKISKDQTAAAGIITYTYYQVINLHERCRYGMYEESLVRRKKVEIISICTTLPKC